MKRALRLLLVFAVLPIAPNAAADPTYSECTSLYIKDKCEAYWEGTRKLERSATVEFKKTVKLPAQSFEQPDACNARVSISYMQMNQKVRIDTTVINEDCVVSGGDYTLFVRTIDEAGEAHTRNITESWARKTAAPIELTQDYDLGSNVGLLSVNVRTSKKTACTCLGEEAGEPEGTQPEGATESP